MKEAIEVVDHRGKVVNTLPLSNNIWQTPFSRARFSVAHRCLLAKKHKRTYEKKKTRGDKRGGGRKFGPQKGSGRARHGSNRAPQFVGGGQAHGPNGDLKFLPTLNKKNKRLALKELLSEKMKLNEIKVVQDIILSDYKTKAAKDFLDTLFAANILTGKKNMIVLSQDDENFSLLERSFRNLENVEVTSTYLDVVKIIPYNLLISYKAFQELENNLGDKIIN